MNAIADNLRFVRKKIMQAALANGRDPSQIKLVAVSKGKTEADVEAAIAAGQLVFGENRVQEAKAKFANLRAANPALELHLIGPLQTNKADDAVRLFDVIQTLDRPSLAEALAKAIKKTGRVPRLYIEVNSGSEPQKAGVAPEDFGSFLDFCRDACGLAVNGVMCIPPQAGDPTPHFLRLKTLAEQYGLAHISMGMSADFETAIRCGATEVRVGSAIFGER